MGKAVKKVGSAVGGVVKKAAPVLGGVAGFALGGPAGAALGAGAGSLLSGGLGGDSKEVVTGSTTLTPEGLAQFNFAGDQLQNALRRSAVQAGGADFSAATNAFNSINFGGINSAISRLQGFDGTQAAKDALNNIAGFRGSDEAFRTLAALEDFGAAEQDFVTDARNAVLSFDEGFQSQALPLLQQAAEGQFLTEAAGNPFLADMIDVAQRPVIENFQSEVLPSILSTFAGTGGVGSSLRAGFTAQNARDLQQQLGDISTTLSFNTFESEREKQLAAQQAILGFEGQGLDRQLAARTTNLNAAQQTAQLLLAAREAAGSQATQLSAQELAALEAAASGQVALSGQQQAALAAALQGQLGVGQLRVSQGQGLAGIASQQQALNIANAQLKANRIDQLLQFQQNAAGAGQVTTQNLVKPGLI